MNLKLKIAVLVSVLCLQSGESFSSGFYISNQSSSAIALSGAHVALTGGADASYYNPANMVWQSDNMKVEGSGTTIVLPSISYRDSRTPIFNGDSKTDNFFVPQLFMVSKGYDDLRFGFSVTSPFGLSKRWEQPLQRAYSEEFSLKVVEGNPVLALKISDHISVGGGFRVIYADAQARSLAANPPLISIAPLSTLSRNLEGDAWDIGYNLALSIKPKDRLILGATYRSEVELGLQGDAQLRAMAGAVPVDSYDGGGRVDLSTPARLALGAAYSFTKLTTELVWERVFWSAFDQLDFQYDRSLLGTPLESFDLPLAKRWSDSEIFKLGLTYRWSDKLKYLVGVAYTETPVPTETLGFDLPGSNAISYSGGFAYQFTPQLQLSLSYLYNYSKSRAVYNFDELGQPKVSGVFTDGGAHLVNTSIAYNF